MDVEAITADNTPRSEPLPLQLTRRQLYDVVWDTPIDLLASRYDISNVGLAKICRRFDVPVPPRGYWQKLAAGIKVPRSKLSASRDDKGNVLIVTLHPRINRKEPEPILCSAIRNQRTYEDLPEHKIVVITPLAAISRVHPLVRQTAAILRKTKMVDRGLMRAHGESILDVQVCNEQLDRAMCIIDALIKALETRGFPVACRPPRPVQRSRMGAPTSWAGGEVRHGPVTCVKVDDQDVLVTIREHRTRIDLQKAAEMSGARKDASTLEHIYPRYDFVGSGRLILAIQHHIGNWGSLAEWKETSTHKLDDMLNDVVVGVVAAAEEFRELLANWANQERDRIDQAERAREEQRLRDIETARVRVLEEQAMNWYKARQIREYIAAARVVGDDIPTAIIANGMTHSEWLRWAEAYVRRLDPLNGADL